MATKNPPILLFLLHILCGTAHCRFISDLSLPSDLLSDGRHLPLSVASETCDETYGFLPCTTTIIGNLFLILVYGSLMYLAATYLSGGSELLLEILGPGVVGGLFWSDS